MNKTPEELAIEFADECVTDAGYMLSKAGFLAGYEAAAPQWISVKDRLPDKDSTVLVYTEDQDTYMAKIYKDAEAWPISNSCGCCGTEEKFTHWMPLPQPPKEEK